MNRCIEFSTYGHSLDYCDEKAREIAHEALGDGFSIECTWRHSDLQAMDMSVVSWKCDYTASVPAFPRWHHQRYREGSVWTCADPDHRSQGKPFYIMGGDDTSVFWKCGSSISDAVGGANTFEYADEHFRS